MRNSSLVEWTCADNSRGSSAVPKRRDGFMPSVGERRIRDEAKLTRFGGLYTSENAGMSSESGARNTTAVILRVPGQG